MKKLYILIAPTITALAFVGVAVLVSGCGSSSSNSPNTNNDQSLVIPLGDEVVGLSLTGPLSGKKAYKLDSRINIPNCWNDSVNWVGSELYFGLSSASFTKLLAGQGLVRDMACSLPRDQGIDDYFDIYRAKLENGVWQTFYQNIDDINSDAGASVSGTTMAYTVYNPSGDWEIFLTEQISEDVWNTPVAFERNSTCLEDNAHVYANGTKIIFESTRLDSSGSTCDSNAENHTLWFSEKTGSAWSAPTLITGDPNEGKKNTQPWVDETNGYLYWTSDTECACIRRIAWVNDATVGSFETVITPDILSLFSSTETADGKIVFVGEYSQSDKYAFVSCAQATDSGVVNDPDFYLGKWSMDVDLCVIPLE